MGELGTQIKIRFPARACDTRGGEAARGSVRSRWRATRSVDAVYRIQSAWPGMLSNFDTGAENRLEFGLRLSVDDWREASSGAAAGGQTI
jgi:hypothetical protein